MSDLFSQPRLRIAIWNVNSLRARLPVVRGWIEQVRPDILMIQEIKNESFPESDFEGMGYRTVYVGQKAWNGVATLTLEKAPVLVLNALPGEEADDQARYLEVDVGRLRCINIYLPNGNPVGSEKFPYKLRWMERLRERLGALRAEGVPFLVGGDFNVIPQPQDCHDPAAWSGDALFRPETRRAWRALANLGLSDAFRLFYAGGGHYSYWDYQGRAFETGRGIRIDHFLLSPEIVDRAVSCEIDPTPRGWDQPSDHTPVVLTISSTPLS